MFAFKRLLSIFIMTSLVACGAIIPIPKIAADGKFYHIYVDKNLVVEFEYESKTECADMANSASNLDANTRFALATKTMIMECSPFSSAGYLKIKGNLKDIITNKIYNTSFISTEICNMFANDTSIPRYVYTCSKIE